jgi:acyl-CoA dehydrogenase
LGAPGSAFVIAQTRLGGGRIHHAMRTVGQLKRCFDMMCERALSRETRDGRLADYQLVQDKIADSYIEIEQFKLLVLRTAWLIDKYNDYRKTRKDIAAIKVAMPKVYHDVAQRAMQVHGALGISNEMPFSRMMVGAQVMAIADGPTEVHKVTIAKQVLRDYKPVDGLFPSAHIPTRRAAARERYAELLEQEVANL